MRSRPFLVIATPAEPHLAEVHRLPTALTEDAALALAAVRGEERAAEAIWDRFSPLVRGIARRALGPQGEVSDLVQETFLQFFRLITELRNPESLRSFLIGITLRLVSNELRRRRVRRWLHLTESGSLPETPGLEEDEEAREALRRLYCALDRLGDGDRLIFVLRHIEGLELTDVAASLGMSLATAKRRLAKTMDRLFAISARDPVLSDYLSIAPPGGSP
jgi:RNA polymerase sigma-70 factor (ECF subfamily)